MNSLYTEFEVERLKRYLQAHRSEAHRLAIAHFDDYLELASEYKKLEQKFQSRSPTNLTNQTQLQAEYSELLECFLKSQKLEVKSQKFYHLPKGRGFKID